MKKIISFTLILFMLLTSFMPKAGTAFSRPMQELSPIKLNDSMVKATPFHYDFQPAIDHWKSIVGMEQPGRFTNVTYTLADGVVLIGDSVVKSIQSAGQMIGGVL